MITAFITIRVLDFLDILLVAFLMYRIYLWIKGTVAINIFIGIFAIYLFWLLVKALNMELIGSILGQVIGVGVIALIIVFQQEIRRFLLVVGSKYISNNAFSLENLFPLTIKKTPKIDIQAISSACFRMAKAYTGALIVISKKSEMELFAETGDIINADFSGRLLESIFHKGNPLHDGAVIIKRNKIYAARCVLPITERIDLPHHYGMRHKAALGMTENTDAIVIVISEERGTISVARRGDIIDNLSRQELVKLLSEEFPEKQSAAS